MKSIDQNVDLQGLFAELKQLEQDLLEITKKEFPDFNNDAYFTEIFAEINANKANIENLLEQNREAEQELLLAQQEEKELERTKNQLQQQAKAQGKEI